MNYLRAENWKHKRTFVRKLLFLAPFVTILLSALSPLWFQMNSYNWWYVLLYPGALTLVCCLVEQRDGHKLEYRAITPLPVSLGSVWRAKIGVAAIYALAANMVFLVLNLLGAFVLLLVFDLSMTISVPQAVLGSICIVLFNLWQIPLCIWLSHKCGIFLTLIINAGVGSILGILLSATSLWMFCPYAWVPRLMISVLGILPNGEPVAALSGGM